MTAEEHIKEEHGEGPCLICALLEEVARLRKDSIASSTLAVYLGVENTRLREALEKIGGNLIPTPISIARAALKDKP